MIKPWLYLPASLAHNLAPVALEFHAFFNEPRTYTWKPLNWRKLHFSNRLGIAGGVDKDGENIEAWWTYGPGFIEVGTITPRAQGPNEGKIIDRDRESRALWNRMGFPGSGAYRALENLKDIPRPWHTPIFINIGKNRTTPNEEAVQDYAECIETLTGYADAFVVNISSPNTKGLRELLQPANLRRFLEGVLSARRLHSPGTPLLLKISPDLDDSDLRSVVELSASLGIDGFIATNTTLAREPGSPFPTEGGVSGGPLAQRSKDTLKKLVETLGASKGDLLVISAGGVLSPGDVFERLDLGADLVQIYTALIYEGPCFFEKTSKAARHLGNEDQGLLR